MTIGKSACFRIEANFEPLYHPLQAIIRVLPSPLPPVDVVLLTEFLPQLRATNGLPSSILWIIVGYLGGSYKPEAHVSIRCGTFRIAITGLRCHFGSCVNSTCFRMSKVTTPKETSPFGSPCILFSSSLGLSGSPLHRIVL